MKVLIVTGIFPPDIGGPATYVPWMAAALCERGHKVLVITASDPENLIGDSNSRPFEIIRLNRRSPFLKRQLSYIWYIISHGRCVDVIYANGLLLETTIANMWLHKPLVVKIVGDWAWERAVTYGWHSPSFNEFQSTHHPLKIRALRRLQKWWTSRADKVVVPSCYLGRWIQNCGISPDKIVTVYNAVSPDTKKSGPNLPLNTPVKVVTVGRLVAWKHIDRIIRAVASMEQVGLLVVGEGPERERLLQLSRHLNISDRVQLVGQKNKAETMSLMAGCDIFVLNSSYEGFPHVVLEAMAIGVPVVATAVGGTTEIIESGKNGLLIEGPDEKELTRALLELSQTPSRRQALAEAAKRTVERFSFPEMIDQTEAVLLECAGRVSTNASG